MNKVRPVILGLCLLLNQTCLAANSLICGFGMSGVAIINSRTQITDDGKLGEFTAVAYQGTKSKQVANIPLSLAENELYHFQLDEGFDEKNVFVIVYKEKNKNEKMIAMIENPQAQYFKQMKGECSFANLN